jgi:hypothetical protein
MLPTLSGYAMATMRGDVVTDEWQACVTAHPAPGEGNVSGLCSSATMPLGARRQRARECRPD